MLKKQMSSAIALPEAERKQTTKQSSERTVHTPFEYPQLVPQRETAETAREIKEAKEKKRLGFGAFFLVFWETEP